MREDGNSSFGRLALLSIWLQTYTMAPKKSARSKAKAPTKKIETNGQVDEQERNKVAAQTEGTKPAPNGSSKKRESEDAAAKRPSKAPRRSARGAPAETVDPVKLINFLLSPDSLPLCSPQDELSDIESRGQDLRTYTTQPFTPFEELECALILSRPIGHKLGLRSIRTLFNHPHNLSSPKAIKAAGKDGCRAALDEARTQHRQKTAEELVLLAEAATEHLGEGEDDESLEKLRKDCGYNVEKEREMLKKHIKGMAKTGIDIFARRIQGSWEEWYPFADNRTLKALDAIGVKGAAEGLSKTIADDWEKLQTQDMLGNDENEKKRNVFAMVLERVIEADLEGNMEEVKSFAA